MFTDGTDSTGRPRVLPPTTHNKIHTANNRSSSSGDPKAHPPLVPYDYDNDDDDDVTTPKSKNVEIMM